MDYNGKLILAPMVRVGTLPMRLLAAGYGADIVYSEELVDKRVIASVRRVNEALGTVDFLDKGGEQGGRAMFCTIPSEQPRLVFQLGTADGVAALAAASRVAGDVAAVDVNMGCPKAFSLQGGMGAALLKKPEAAEDILKTLRRNLQLPVSCKIRLLDDPRDTVELARRLAACGISALAVHGRTAQQRPRDPADWGRIRLVVDALAGEVPVIANGDVMSYDDAVRVRQETGCVAAMVARAAMWNASVFRPQGFLALEQVQREYVRLAVRWDNALPNTKYCLKEMADAPVSFVGRAGGVGALVGHEANTAITRARDGRQLCGLVGVADQPPYQDLDVAAWSPLLPASAQQKSACKTGGGGNRPPKQQQQQQQQQGAAKKRARDGAVVELQPKKQQQGQQQQQQQQAPAPAPAAQPPQQQPLSQQLTNGDRGTWSGTGLELEQRPETSGRGLEGGRGRGNAGEAGGGGASGASAPAPGGGLAPRDVVGDGGDGGGRGNGDGSGGPGDDGGIEAIGGGGSGAKVSGEAAAAEGAEGAGGDGACLKRPRRHDGDEAAPVPVPVPVPGGSAAPSGAGAGDDAAAGDGMSAAASGRGGCGPVSGGSA